MNVEFRVKQNMVLLGLKNTECSRRMIGRKWSIVQLNIPSSRVVEIADYLGVSVDYLMTGGKRETIIETAKLDDSISNASDRLKEYFAKLAKMPTEQQEHIISLIDMLNKNNK